MKRLRSINRLWIIGAVGASALVLFLLLGLSLLFKPAGVDVAGVQVSASCGLAQPAFCETFDAPAGIGNRSGQMNGTLWGVSRVSGSQNFSAPADGWPSTNVSICGSTKTITAGSDIFICNGQLVEGQDDNQTVTAMTMYPKQPFDFAGRTGKVTFDVSNDSQGNHAAWPEFWMTDKPVSGPFTHEGGGSVPQHGFGIRFAGHGNSSCPEGNGTPYVGVDSAITVTNWVGNDTFNGGNLNLQVFECVKMPSAPGQLNHYEIDVAQNQIDVFGTDAGTTGPLKKLATLVNANLSFTRGLIWIEDVHYNGSKFNTQGTHTFTWDNVGFDGPVLARDLAYDANDQLTSTGQNDNNNGLPVLNLGWFVNGNTTQTFIMNNVANPSTATGAMLTFDFWYEQTPPFNINYSVNGRPHTMVWPYPDNASFTQRAIMLPVPLSDLQAGTNTLAITPGAAMNIFNFDLILAGAGGGGSGGPPPPPPPPAATNTPVPTATTVPPVATPTTAPVAQTCTMVVRLNGVDQRFTRPLSDCANQ